MPDQPFPPKAGGIRRRRRRADRSSIPLILPNLDLSQEESDKATVTQQRPDSDQATVRQAAPIVGAVEQEQRRPVQAVSSDLETPITSQAPSEADSTHPTTPSSAVPQQATPRQAAHSRTATKPVIPAVPIKVAVPNISPSQKKAPIPAPFATEKADGTSVAVQSNLSPSTETAKASPSLDTSTSATIPASPPVKQPPSSWAALFQSKKPAAVAPAASAVVPMNGAASAKSTSLADVIRSYSVDSDSKIAFIEPRGLHNTGNMCYMNSVRPAPGEPLSDANERFRFCRFLYFVYLFMNSSTRLESEPCIASRARLRCWTRCKHMQLVFANGTNTSQDHVHEGVSRD